MHFKYVFIAIKSERKYYMPGYTTVYVKYCISYIIDNLQSSQQDFPLFSRRCITLRKCTVCVEVFLFHHRLVVISPTRTIDEILYMDKKLSI